MLELDLWNLNLKIEQQFSLNTKWAELSYRGRNIHLSSFAALSDHCGMDKKSNNDCMKIVSTAK